MSPLLWFLNKYRHCFGFVTNLVISLVFKQMSSLPWVLNKCRHCFGFLTNVIIAGVDDDGDGCLHICAQEQQTALVPADSLQQMQGLKVRICSINLPACQSYCTVDIVHSHKIIN